MDSKENSKAGETDKLYDKSGQASAQNVGEAGSARTWMEKHPVDTVGANFCSAKPRGVKQ